MRNSDWRYNRLEYDTDMLQGSYPHKKYMVCMVKNIMRGGVTDAGRTISEDRATEPTEAGGWVSHFNVLKDCRQSIIEKLIPFTLLMLSI